MRLLNLAKLIALLLALLWAEGASAYEGSGAVWGYRTGDYYMGNYAGTDAGLLAADAFMVPGGTAILGPGTEGLALPPYRAGVRWIWQRHDAYRIYGPPLEAWPAGALRFRADSTGIAVTGKAVVSDSLRVPHISTDNIINVRTWGARGDSLTDDTDAVIAAYNAMSANAALYFPKGKYRLGTWISQTLSKPIRILGDGMQNSIVFGTAGQSFLSVRKDIQVQGITFDTWSTVFDFSSLSTVLEYVDFDATEIKAASRAIYASSASPAIGMRKFRFNRGRITNMSSYAIQLNLAVLEDAHVFDSFIKGAVERGIGFGNNTVAYSADRGRYIVRGCTIDSITAVQPASALAVALYGWRAIVTENHIRTVFKTTDSLSVDPDATDANGIYTKCRFTTISHNVMVDAGQSEAFINLKGQGRSEPASSSPHGYAVIVNDNVLLDTGTTGRKTKGTKLATSDAYVHHNYYEGFTDVAVYTDGDSSSDYLIESNFVRAHRGSSAYTVFGSGRRIRLIGNEADSVSASYDTTLQNTGFKIQKTGGGSVDLINNRAHAIVNRGATPVGILIKPSGVLNNMRILDNDIDGATNGVQFTTTAPDSVFIRHTTCRGVTDCVKYSVTPTNLIEMPAAADVVSYEAADDAMIANGTNPQELRIYSTRTDASNYERLSLQSNLSNSRIVTEGAGTGSVRALEWGAGSNKWRITTSGNMEAMIDATFDIGASGARPRALNFVRGIADSLRANQGLFVGGDRLDKYLEATATLDFDLTAVVSQDLTITVAGAALGDRVAPGVPNASVTADTAFFAWVSATDTVTIRAFRLAGTPNPASGTFKVSVFK